MSGVAPLSATLATAAMKPSQSLRESGETPAFSSTVSLTMSPETAVSTGRAKNCPSSFFIAGSRAVLKSFAHGSSCSGARKGAVPVAGPPVGRPEVRRVVRGEPDLDLRLVVVAPGAQVDLDVGVLLLEVVGDRRQCLEQW